MAKRKPSDLEWVPIVGAFEVEPSSIVFSGRTVTTEDGKTQNATGYVLSNQLFGGGSVQATIVFDSSEADPACGLILFYQPATQSIIEAQIGGGNIASTWIYAGTKWTNYGRVGFGTSIEVGRKYALKATVAGSQVVVNLDGVDVLASNLPMPLPRGQTGIWCQSPGKVRISGFSVTREKPTAFVIMQFTPPYNELFTEVIRPVCNQLGFVASRADEKFGPGVIIKDIERQINEAKVIIADITPSNPNVYYEVGYAHALQKPTILIAEHPTELPFDVSPFRTLFYENSIAGKAKVEAGLRSHLEAIQTQW